MKEKKTIAKYKKIKMMIEMKKYMKNHDLGFFVCILSEYKLFLFVTQRKQSLSLSFSH